MHGEGDRRVCPYCSPSALGRRELRGPRNITSSNIDRIFDDGGRRFLVIEEKNPREPVPDGQIRMLHALARLEQVSVWGVRGTPEAVTVSELDGLGKTVPLVAGSFEDYQRVVLEWFDSPPAGRMPTWLDALAEAPFTAPEGIHPDVWSEFDTALTRLVSGWKT